MIVLRRSSKLKSLFKYLGAAFVLILSTLAPFTSLYIQPAAAVSASAVYHYTKTFDSTNGTVQSKGITSDASGNVYIVGSFTGTIIFDGAGGSNSAACGNSESGCSFLTKYSANSSYGWTETFEYNTGHTINGVATDLNGNVYTTGTFFGDTVAFDVVGGSDIRTGSGTFITKHNADGSYGWTKTSDNTSGYAISNGVAVDASGNVAITGSFHSTVVFDGTGGSDSRTSVHDSTFVTKYNADSSYAWTKTFDTSASAANSGGKGITTDANGNVYIFGNFNATVVFDGVGGSHSISCGGSDMGCTFLMKYNADGSYGWIEAFDCHTDHRINSATTDTNGNLYTAGAFTGTVNFDVVGGNDARTVSNTTAFVTKHNANGSYGWTKTSDTTSGYANNNSVVVDVNGNIFITGYFGGTVIFDGVGGIDSQTSDNASNFITKYNADGSYGWTKTFDTTNGYMAAASVAVDANGNIYTTGWFSGTVIFNGPGGKDSRTSDSNHSNVFLTSYRSMTPIGSNSTVAYRYTKTFDTTAGTVNNVVGVTNDSNDNNYISGYFGGTVVFDGVGGSDSQSSDNMSAFITKYNANGSYGWTKTINSDLYYIDNNSITTDRNGNVYVVGYFSGTVVFDGVGGSDSQSSDNMSAFITKYNANGSYGWTKIFDTSVEGTSAQGKSVVVEPNGNIFITGYFGGTVVFDGVGGSDSQSSDNMSNFITKYNADGSYGWTKTFAVDNSGYAFAYGTGTKVDASGNIFITGYFISTVTFDGIDGSDSIYCGNLEGGCSFITKYNADGSYGWTKTFDMAAYNNCVNHKSMAVDNNGNIFITGYFYGIVTFDGIGGIDSQTNPSGNGNFTDAFITKYNADGSYGWTKTFDNLNGDASSDNVVTDSLGNIYITGTFNNTVIFDGVGGSDSRTDIGSGNSFLTKYNADGSYGWTKTFYNASGSSSVTSIGIAADINNNIYLDLVVAGIVIFDGESGSDVQVGNASGGNSSLTKYNADGSYGWTKTFNSSYDTSVSSSKILVDSNSNIYRAGLFIGTVTFDGVGGSDSRTSAGGGSFLTSYQTIFSQPPVVPPVIPIVKLPVVQPKTPPKSGHGTSTSNNDNSGAVADSGAQPTPTATTPSDTTTTSGTDKQPPTPVISSTNTTNYTWWYAGGAGALSFGSYLIWKLIKMARRFQINCSRSLIDALKTLMLQ